tara:strand:+ start:339 stop:1070 length:732 start_codon:yes stop_codon:yes gene_type:complete
MPSLHTIFSSQSSKTKGCHVTYRAGGQNKFATCPSSCVLKPAHEKGATRLDVEYTKQVARSCPRHGFSWLYTHFSPDLWRSYVIKGKTVFNHSCDTLEQAIKGLKTGINCVLVVAPSWWNGPSIRKRTAQGVTVVRCPAEYIERVNCGNCGGKTPLCARPDRNYVIGFTAHGAAKNQAADPEKDGGCYGNGGNVRLWWQRLADKKPEGLESEKLSRFVSDVSKKYAAPRLRHHIVGDLGLNLT